jgi:carbon monoxide dehydrogenase subunit G
VGGDAPRGGDGVKIHNECTIAAPIGVTWPAVIDLARLAAALPGASLERSADGASYRGTMKVKFGPVVAEYSGTARIEELDDDRHVAVFRVHGREVRGQGSATATIRNALAIEGRGTRLSIDTELSVSGIAAQLGGGMIEDVSAKLLAEFARRLEGDVSGAQAPAHDAGAALDVGSAAADALRRRVVPLAVYAVVLALATTTAYRLGRRR